MRTFPLCNATWFIGCPNVCYPFCRKKSEFSLQDPPNEKLPEVPPFPSASVVGGGWLDLRISFLHLFQDERGHLVHLRKKRGRNVCDLERNWLPAVSLCWWVSRNKKIKKSINWKPLLSQNPCLQIGIAGLKQTFPRVHFSYRLILRGYYKKSICLSANICGLS